MEVSLRLLREALAASERHPVFSCVLYTFLSGTSWPIAYVGFAYARSVDDSVDGEEDAARALSILARQRELMDSVYAGDPAPREGALRDRMGGVVFAWDARNGSRLRPSLAALLELIRFDVERRGQPLPQAELDRYALRLGNASLEYLACFVAPDTELPAPFVASVSRAYIRADALMDLSEDLRMGIINVPAERLEPLRIVAGPLPSAVRSWIREEADAVTTLFEVALSEARRLPVPPLRRLAILRLRRKRRLLLRHLRAGRRDDEVRSNGPSREGEGPQIFWRAAPAQGNPRPELEVGADVSSAVPGLGVDDDRGVEVAR